MIESGGYKRFDKLVVVHCRPEVQLERLILRNGFSREEAQSRINSQMPQEEKQRFADFLIELPMASNKHDNVPGKFTNSLSS